ncbi:unnamed protein product, partial [Mycena citricolor]
RFPPHTTMSRAPAERVKRRRLPGSCDACRQRKVRCDSSVMPGNICSNCMTLGIQCTRVHHDTTIEQQYGDPSMVLPRIKRQRAARDHVATVVLEGTQHLQDDELRRILQEVCNYSRSLEN